MTIIGKFADMLTKLKKKPDAKLAGELSKWIEAGGMAKLRIGLTEFLQPEHKIEDYKFIKEIARGSYGEIGVYEDPEGRQVAIKVIGQENMYGDEYEPETYLGEVHILQHLKPYCHQYVLCYITSFEDDDNYYIVTEYLADHVPADEYFKGVHDEKTALPVIREMLNGLAYLHDLKVVHNDVKPPNILVDPKTRKLKYIDFGISCLDRECDKPQPFTAEYTPPERIREAAKGLKKTKFRDLPSLVTDWNLERGFQADIWALGATLLDLITKGDFGKRMLQGKRYPQGFIQMHKVLFDKSWDFTNFVDPSILAAYPHVIAAVKVMLLFQPEDRSLLKAQQLLDV